MQVGAIPAPENGHPSSTCDVCILPSEHGMNKQGGKDRAAHAKYQTLATIEQLPRNQLVVGSSQTPSTS